MKTKYNLSTFETAADLIDSGAISYACLAIGDATIGERRGYETPELKLFREIFELVSVDGYSEKTFGRLAVRSFPDEEFPCHEGLRETRVLALCLTHEIARRKNRQGGHAARAKKRAEKRAEKLKLAEFIKSTPILNPADLADAHTEDERAEFYWKGEADRLRAQNAALRAAAEDFIAKVDSGRARSVDSYGKFKEALGIK